MKPVRYLLMSTLLGCLVIVAVGCSNSSTSRAQPRESEFEPVIGAYKDSVTAENNTVKFDFVTRDHFACLAVDVAGLVSHPDLADVPWSALETQLAEVVGEPNAQVEQISRMWVLLDGRGLDFTNPDAPSPMTLVVDYREAIETSSLEQITQSRRAKLLAEEQESDEDSDQPQLLGGEKSIGSIASQIGPRRILIGSPAIVDAFDNDGNGAVPRLTDQLQQLKLDTDIEGAVSLDPIRDLITQFTSMASKMGGDQLKAWEQLPQALQSTNLRISLDGPDTLWLQLKIDDPKLVQAIAEAANGGSDGGQSSTPFGGGGGLSMLAGMGGMGPGDINTGRQGMFETASGPLLESIGKQIREDDLFSVTTTDTEVNVRLARPNGLSELITAAVADAGQQYRLLERTAAARQLAAALSAYHADHGCLPPAGQVVDHPDGLPDQFNWRVGLLSYLDPERYQKFKFSEAWDSPHNREVAGEVPDAFRATMITQPNETPATSLVMKINATPGGVYQGEQPPKLEAITDTLRYTAILAEAPVDESSMWFQPDAGQLTDAGSALGDPHEAGVMFVDATFDVRAIERTAEKPAAVLTIAGDESVSRNDLLRLLAPNP